MYSLMNLYMMNTGYVLVATCSGCVRAAAVECAAERAAGPDDRAEQSLLAALCGWYTPTAAGQQLFERRPAPASTGHPFLPTASLTIRVFPPYHLLSLMYCFLSFSADASILCGRLSSTRSILSWPFS